MNEKNIFILTGPIRTGKTTRLIEWCKKNNAAGIVTPVIDGKRMFCDIKASEFFPMEAGEDETRVMTIGKYIFSAAAFLSAMKIIEDESKKNPKWLVIDEIGPMELKGHGFSSVLKNILTDHERKYNLVLVVRDTIFEEVLKHFGIDHFDLLKI